MSDGSTLRQSWYSAVNEAEAYFRRLLTSPSNEWKRISTSQDSSSSKKGKTRVVGVPPELSDVVVHRNSNRSGSEDVYRVVLDVPVVEEQVSLEPWNSVLTTPELRAEWDPAVEEAHLLEVLDRSTQISKTNFTLGWPANPRDSITISRSFGDPSTVINISTSLPRSPDEPAYLRPSPPFVRSHVHLFAWCIQHLPAPPDASTPGKLRLTCFWQHDFREMWGFGSSSSTLAQQLATMALSLLKTVLKRGGRVPKLSGYGNGVSIERIRFQVDREALSVDYAIIPDEDEGGKENKRLTRSIECVLPSLEGWEVQVSVKASSEEVEQLPWSAQAVKANSNPSSLGPPDQIILRLTHAALLDDHSVLKVKVVVEASGGTRGLRLNGLPKKILDLAEQRDPMSYSIPQQILRDVASAADMSFATTTTASTAVSERDDSRPRNTKRSAAAEKSILSRVKRNYIYFSSLLQEPEAKWRRTTEARGVSITQLDSIDPTLVVYRAEATFVGVGLWDLYGAVTSPGARVYWDKQHEDATLLEDVNELTELWHFKTKPAWPTNGRDAVVLKTVYKSPTTIHVFFFSADDPHLFPSIPPASPTIIRTQVDLQGWSIEALSPTTTSLTLLEQSDPKGWTNKTSIPQQMINTLAGIGEFAIKCGGPPMVTRLRGARAREMRYDHEKGSFRVEYEVESRRSIAGGLGLHRVSSADGGEAPSSSSVSLSPRQVALSSSTSSSSSVGRAVERLELDPSREDGGDDGSDSSRPTIECEIRCDVDTWASSLDIVVDPPPHTMSCLRRHRLSASGGGLWLTLSHDSLYADDDRHLVIVRRAPGKEKGLVMVNGAKVQVDVEEMGEAELWALRKQGRVKPPRIPLDQPPVVGVVKRRKAEWGMESGERGGGGSTAGEGGDSPVAAGGVKEGSTSALSAWASAPVISSPLSRLWSYTIDQATATTQQAVAAITPAASGASLSSSLPSATKAPMQYALEALAWTQEFHSSSGFLASSPQDGWTLVSDKGGLSVHRKVIPEVSSIIPVHKGQKVIERVSAEELAALIVESEEGRKVWDDRFDSLQTLQSYGHSCKAMFLTAKGGFPFRDRGFYIASVVARTQASQSTQASERGSLRGRAVGGDVAEQTGVSGAKANAIFIVSASFAAESISPLFNPEKHNPYQLPLGRMYVDAWVLETLDPYTKENYAIPSTRCTRLVAVDYAGAIPATVNGMINASLPRVILALEAYFHERPSSGAGATGVGANVPVVRMPAGCLVVAEKRGEDRLASVSWKMRRRDDRRVVVDERFISGSSAGSVTAGVAGKEKVYRARLFVTMATSSSSSREGKEKRVDAKRVVSVSPRRRREPSEGVGSLDQDVLASSSMTSLAGPGASSTSYSSGSNSLEVRSSSSSSSSSQHEKELSSSSSVETLRSVRSHDAPLNRMPGTMVFATATSSKATSSKAGAIPLMRQRSVSSSDAVAGTSYASFTRPELTSGISDQSPSAQSSPGITSKSTFRYNAPGSPALPSSASASGSGSTSQHLRGRTMSSAFTAKGEVKPILDFVVGEVVVDTRMYPEGYSVVVKSRKVCRKGKEVAGMVAQGKERGVWTEVNAKGKGREWDGEMYLKIGSGEGAVEVGGSGSAPGSVAASSSSGSTASSSTTDSSATTSASGSSAARSAEDDTNFLPLIYSVYTMPVSPMHSSSLNVEAGPMRHLLRLSLPTAQYQVSEVYDPLKGEMRTAPKKPAWLKVLEGDDEDDEVDESRTTSAESNPATEAGETSGGGSGPNVKKGRLQGAVVDVYILPRGQSVSGQPKEKEKDPKRKKMKKVEVNGVEVSIVGEKESLTSLGRDELLDDRVGKMPILFRTPNETEALPEELRVPLAIAGDLVDPAILGGADSESNSGGAPPTAYLHPDGDQLKDSAGRVGGEGGTKCGEVIPGLPAPTAASTSSGSASGTVAPGGLASSGGWALWSSYRFGFNFGGAPATETTLDASGAKDTQKVPGDVAEGEANNGGVTTQVTKVDGEDGGAEPDGKDGKEGANEETTGGAVGTQLRGGGLQTRQYPLATVIIVALISFLIGSLLRSLLSPADFIYVVTNMKEAEEANTVSGGGWREIRRLLEIKYIFGGWDFQIAAVRRHM